MLAEKAGLDSVAVLNDQTKRTDGKLDLWCGDGKEPLPRDYIRDGLRFELGDNAIMVFGPIGLSSGRRLDHLFPYYVDADQVEALIAELTEPKQESKPRGRHKHSMRDDILAEYDRRCRDGEPHENADLERWAAKELKVSPKYANTTVTSPPADTISRWLRERERPPT
jgi:hypothetical protein